MPELPEVEIVRRGLEPALAGRRLVRVEARRPDLRFPFPPRFASRLEGRRVIRIERRAKYLLAYLSSGEVLVMHLGMTGRFTVKAKAAKAPRLLGDYDNEIDPDPRHDHVVFAVSGGATVTYADPRRFGFMLLVPESDLAAHPLFRALGVEPLGPGLTPAYLAARAAGRRSNLKAFLMDQRIVAGLGNIYVCEALFRAGLSPRRSTATLARKNGTPSKIAAPLVAAIRGALDDAIAAGGSTLRDYRQADGTEGRFQDAFAVYDRAGEPCLRPNCPGVVRRLVQAGRSSFYCPVCQR